jgi:ABC-type hemin transport system ATPase subunit
MFDRQMEAHHVISFLLDTQLRGFEELEVLPIVGPYGVGKSTLVSHVCKDERICDHFSEFFY